MLTRRTILLLLYFIAVSACVTAKTPSDEKFEQSVSKYSNYINRLDQDFLSKVNNCIVYISSYPVYEQTNIKTFGAGDYKEEREIGTVLLLGPVWALVLPPLYEDRGFERHINDYFKREGWNEDYLIKLFQRKPLLPSHIQVQYEIVSWEHLLQADWKEADAYVVLVLGAFMPAQGGGGRAQLKLSLLSEITVIPKKNANKWKEFITHLDQAKGMDIIKEKEKIISENKAPDIYEQGAIKSTDYFDKRTWSRDDGKFFIEQFRSCLTSLAEKIREKMPLK